MKEESFMDRTVHPAHKEVNYDCAWLGMGVHPVPVHNMHMPSSARKHRQKPDVQESRARTYLRHWREYRGLSLEAAADVIGIKHSQLSRIERGKQEYKQSYLEGLARLYHTSVWSLLYCPPDLPPDQMFAAFQNSIKPLSQH